MAMVAAGSARCDDQEAKGNQNTLLTPQLGGRKETVGHTFQRTVERYGESIALVKPSGERRIITWIEYFRSSRDFAKSLMAFDLRTVDTVGLVGRNSVDFCSALVGTMLVGSVVAPMPDGNAAEACQRVAKYTAMVLIVCQGRQQLEKFLVAADALPQLRALVLIEEGGGENGGDGLIDDWHHPRVKLFTYAQFLNLGATRRQATGAVDRWPPPRQQAGVAGVAGVAGATTGESSLPCDTTAQFRNATVVCEGGGGGSSGGSSGAGVTDAALAARMAAVEPAQCACLLFRSSHSAGAPRAIMLSHDNVTWTAARLADALQLSGGGGGVAGACDRVLSYLPLWHPLPLMLDVHCHLFAGYTLHLTAADALAGGLSTALAAARPTVFLAPPVVWDRMAAAVRTAMDDALTGCRRLLVTWALRKGAQCCDSRQFGEAAAAGGGGGNVAPPCCYGFADAVVLSRTRQALGLDHCRAALSGGAPLSAATARFFAGFNLPLLQLYGQAECCGVASVSAPGGGAWKHGRCGRALPGTRLRAAAANGGEGGGGGDGEIQVSGRHVFLGYRDDPRRTAAAVDEAGWLHTGDTGALDTDGFLAFTGRLTDVAVLGSAERVRAREVEERLLRGLPCVCMAVVVGDGRPYLAALLTLHTTTHNDDHGDNVGAEEGGQLLLHGPSLQAALDCGSTARTVAAAAVCDKYRAHVERALEVVNAGAASPALRVEAFRLLPVQFSVEGRELSPTFMLRRAVVLEKYAHIIQDMYPVAAKI